MNIARGNSGDGVFGNLSAAAEAVTGIVLFPPETVTETVTETASGTSARGGSGPFGIPFWFSISIPIPIPFPFSFPFRIRSWSRSRSRSWFREGFPFFFSFFFSYFFFFFLFSLLFLFGSFSFRLVSLSFFLFLFLFLSFFLCAPIIPQKRSENKQKVCSICNRSVNFNGCSAVLCLISGNACGKPTAALWKTCLCRIGVSKILILQQKYGILRVAINRKYTRFYTGGILISTEYAPCF